MTSVDFYILPDNSQAASDYRHFACRLAEKAMNLGHRVYIHVDDSNEAARLDTLLWTFRDESFVAHQMASDNDIDSPVVIGWQDSLADAIKPDLLINLGQSIPQFHTQFERIAEIVSEPEQRRQQTRQHYSYYKKNGLSLDTHQL